MTDPKSEIKWFYVCALILLGSSAAWVVFQPHYNIAHWVPHSLLRTIGLPYATILELESNADMLLHPVLAFLMTLCLIKANLPYISTPKSRPFLLMVILMSAAEAGQSVIGRGFELPDLLLGALGSFLAIRIFR